MSTSTLPRLLTTQEVSEYLNLSTSTLANHRALQTGLPYVRVGGRVLYKESDVLELLENSTVLPVSA